MSVLIKEEDFIQSIADGIQFISYYHPVDYIRHLARAYAVSYTHLDVYKRQVLRHGGLHPRIGRDRAGNQQKHGMSPWGLGRLRGKGVSHRP